jgi:hypothetical protein
MSGREPDDLVHLLPAWAIAFDGRSPMRTLWLMRLGAVVGGVVSAVGDELRPVDGQQVAPGQFVVAGPGVATTGLGAGGPG